MASSLQLQLHLGHMLCSALLCIFFAAILTVPGNGQTFFSVDNFGARGDGFTDDSQAFLKTWAQACRASDSVHPIMSIPKGKTYGLGSVTFRGPCTKGLVFQLQGNLVSTLRPGKQSPFWIQFLYVDNIVINGGGTMDGKGQDWWACTKQQRCSDAPTAMTTSFANNMVVQDIKIVSSPKVHLSLFASTHVTLRGITIDSPQDSPNTDGIHMGMCYGVLITDSNIGSGDDCVAMVDGNSNIRVQKSICGPGHGISIGSLGKDNSRILPVTNVKVDGVTFRNTDNGVRIKTWQGGLGFVRGLEFKDIVMENVRNPIIIDQFYCGSSEESSCGNRTNAIQISDVTYRNIKGTTRSVKGIWFACSSTVPCTNIVLQDVQLSRVDAKHGDRATPAAASSITSFCNNVYGKVIGAIVPPVKCMKP